MTSRASLLILALIFALATAGLAQEPQKSNFLKAKFDKKKNITTVTLKSIGLSGSMTQEVGNLAEVPQLDMTGWFTYEGEQLKAPATEATLSFKVTAKYPVYQRAQNLVGVINDETALPFGATTYKSVSQTFMFEEIMNITIPYEAMKKIADAKSFKFILGAREIKLKAKDHDALRELARWMAPAA